MTTISGEPQRTRRSVPLVWVIVILLVVISGGAGGFLFITREKSTATPQPATTPAATSSAETSVPTTPVVAPHPWRLTIDAVSQPAPVAGRFIVYAASEGALELVAIDATTGAIAWTLPASASQIAPGAAPEVAVLGTRVAYLAPVDGPIAALTVVDVTTGEVDWKSPDGAFSDWPTVCADVSDALCSSGILRSSPFAGVLRFDAESGDVLPSPKLGQSARAVGSNLFDTGERHPEVLVATQGSKVAWQQPLHDIFTIPGASTDYGWDFDRISQLGMFVGTVGTPPIRQSKKGNVIDPANSMTAGFRMGDGTVAWRDPGSTYLCGYLTCPGTTNRGYTSLDDRVTAGLQLGIRLRARGLITNVPDTIQVTLSRNARGTLEGFDPTTGRVLWKYDAGRNVGLITQTELPPRLTPETVLLRASDAVPVELDLATGETRAVTETDMAWCTKLVTYNMTAAYHAGGRDIHGYLGQYAVMPCNSSGEQMPTPQVATSAMQRLFAETQGEVAWMESGAIVAAPL